MKRPVWLLVTILTLSLTGLVLAWAGWLQAEAPRPASSWRSEAHAKNHDALTSEAAWRWRRCQATHWRACLLQHQ
jgi:hypothetical protein